jgi:hypothetical protein
VRLPSLRCTVEFPSVVCTEVTIPAVDAVRGRPAGSM